MSLSKLAQMMMFLRKWNLSNRDEHVDNVIKKVNQRLGVICRVKHLIPLSAKLMLYHSLVLPLFDYGDIIWGDKNNSTLMNHLQILQNKSAKIMLDLPPRSSATEALNCLNMKRLFERRFFHRCSVAYKELTNRLIMILILYLTLCFMPTTLGQKTTSIFPVLGLIGENRGLFIRLLTIGTP